jgi:uncharacterized protein (DUF2236 family)
MTLNDVENYFDSMLPELEAGFQTRKAAEFLLQPPAPLYARGPYALITAAAIGLMPNWARELHHLPPPRQTDPWLVAPAARRMLKTLGWVLGTSPHRQAALARIQES